jgi:hypothetical protein
MLSSEKQFRQFLVSSADCNKIIIGANDKTADFRRGAQNVITFAIDWSFPSIM